MTSTTHRPITPELVRAALGCIPPNCDRETWVRVAMAVKAEFAASGFDLWDAWSQQADNYSASDARDTWRSVKAGGGVGIGTLFHMAQEHGFRFPDAEPLSPEQRAELERHQAQREAQRKAAAERDAARYRERAEKARRVAAELWTEASDEGQSPYLERKGIRGHGVRYLRDGTLLIPLRDERGELHNLQRIAPRKPTEEEAAKGKAEKRFLPGARVNGLWHAIGGGADPSMIANAMADPAILLVAEGYATGAALYEAVGHPVAVAFNAGNLIQVAAALAALCPRAALLLCGDDDRDTEARTGKNTGRLKAEAAAKRLRKAGIKAAAVFPQGLPEGGSDFNDLMQHAGAAVVAEQVRGAIQALMGAHEPGEGAGAGAEDDDGEAPKAAASLPALPDPFTLDRQGVWFTPPADSQGNAKRPQWVCTPIELQALTRNEEANGWGYLLSSSDPDGRPKTWAMPSAMLSGDGSEWASRLRDMGLRIAPHGRARSQLQQYIETRVTTARATCTDRVGWHGSVYVLPSASLGEQAGRRYVFQTDSGMDDTFRQRGSLSDWQTQVAGLCAGNSRMVFAVCVALAGPLLRLAGMESGGIHLLGDSSAGKSTALKLAASVWGRPNFMQSWRSTSNALEATAAQHSDCTLILDELGQLDGREAGEVAYMLANDQEKGRAQRTGLLRRRRTWRLLFLSSGELSLADHMAEAGKRTRAGQEVRMVAVPMDAGKGMGGLEELHGHEGGGALSVAMVEAAARSYGTAGRAWLEWLCGHHAEVPQRVTEQIEREQARMLPEGAAPQVGRVCKRFAIVAAAGELATEAGVTGWLPGEASRAAARCFAAWLAARGHLDNGEDAQMLAQVRHFLQAHADGRFTWWHRADDDHAPKTLNRAGFRRRVEADGTPLRLLKMSMATADQLADQQERIDASQVEFIILPEVFKQEVCSGYRVEAVGDLLRRRGHLRCDAGRLTKKQRLPGFGLVNCFHIKASVFDDAP